MTINIEYETDKPLDVDYEKVANDIIPAALDYEKCPYEAEVNLILTDNDAIQEINRDYRQIDRPTDVLSFPMIDFEKESDFSHVEEAVEDYFNPETGELILGDIIVSVEKVAIPENGSWRSSLPTACSICAAMTIWKTQSAR